MISWDLEPGLRFRLHFRLEFRFTFRALSYVIDVYRRTTPVQKKFAECDFVYLIFFRSLSQGPIVRYCTVEQQIHHRTHTWDLFFFRMCALCTGACEKADSGKLLCGDSR